MSSFQQKSAINSSSKCIYLGSFTKVKSATCTRYFKKAQHRAILSAHQPQTLEGPACSDQMMVVVVVVLHVPGMTAFCCLQKEMDSSPRSSMQHGNRGKKEGQWFNLYSLLPRKKKEGNGCRQQQELGSLPTAHQPQFQFHPPCPALDSAASIPLSLRHMHLAVLSACRLLCINLLHRHNTHVA
jgi:hypothetical protein